MLSAGLLYCMEYLERNMDWLQERMGPLIEGKMSVSICVLSSTMPWTTGVLMKVLAAA